MSAIAASYGYGRRAVGVGHKRKRLAGHREARHQTARPLEPVGCFQCAGWEARAVRRRKPGRSDLVIALHDVEAHELLSCRAHPHSELLTRRRCQDRLTSLIRSDVTVRPHVEKRLQLVTAASGEVV